MFGFTIISKKKVANIRECLISISASNMCIKDWMDILKSIDTICKDDVLIDQSRRLAAESEIKANESLKNLRDC